MGLSCSTRLLKYFVFFSNAIICLIGCFFLIISIRVLVNTGIIDHLPELAEDENLNSGVERAGLIMLAIFSGLIFLIGFLGCFGAVNENRAFLLAYSMVLFAFVVLIIASQFMAIAGRKSFEQALEDVLNKKYNTSEARQNFTRFEDAFNCCGATPRLKPVFIEEGLCKGELAKQGLQPDCCSVIAMGVDAGYLILTFFLLIAAVIGLSTSCTLRSALTERLSYTEF
ncbi:CD9 antigen [Toxocara canis]|uniref:CD9 antigen n=1 Tax=Toxocara canis TaxID=6265 RepID=A0A0B2VBD2_TOXCA|nr:CD9 antigen [Toxocara canis]